VVVGRKEEYKDKKVIIKKKLKIYRIIKRINNKIVTLSKLYIIILPVLLIVLDNDIVYNNIINNKVYLTLRSKIRMLKYKYNLNFQKIDKLNEEIGNLTFEDRSYKIIHESNIKESTQYKNIEIKNNKKRSKQLNKFINIYRNSSIQSNSIILADLVHEFIGNNLDTLFIPFTGNSYCYEFGHSSFCQIESISWMVHPSIVAFRNYNYGLKLKDYNKYKKECTEIYGSEYLMINIQKGLKNINKSNYSLYSFNNEVFVFKSGLIK